MSDETKIDWSPPMPDDQMAAAYQSVQAKLTHTAGGEVRNTLQNFVTALTHDPVFAGNIRRNLFKERMSMTCPVWWTRKSDMIDDMDVAFLRLYLEEHYGLRSEKLIYPALNIVSTAQAFHPVRDRLNSLVWDGVPRVRVALHHFLGAEVSDTNEKYLRTFMLGAANRVFYPGCKFELMLVLEGEVIQQIEEKEYPYRAGTCCLVNRSILHNERFTGPAKLCFIGLSVDFVRSLTESASLQLFEAERHLPENPILQFMLANLGQDLRKEYQDLFPTPENTDSLQALTALIARMTHILHEPSAAATYYLKGALCELFDFLSSGFYVTPVHLSSSPESLLFLRISRLLEDTDGRLPRSELARLLNYNGSYLNSIVQRRTGLCLFDYGMTFCFQKAERLLRETTLSVSEIALQLKFTNRTHFYELFRQKYGMTPQQWRKMQKSAEHSE